MDKPATEIAISTHRPRGARADCQKVLKGEGAQVLGVGGARSAKGSNRKKAGIRRT